jgi:hypothetical protein
VVRVHLSEIDPEDGVDIERSEPVAVGTAR